MLHKQAALQDQCHVLQVHSVPSTGPVPHSQVSSSSSTGPVSHERTVLQDQCHRKGAFWSAATGAFVNAFVFSHMLFEYKLREACAFYAIPDEGFRIADTKCLLGPFLVQALSFWSHPHGVVMHSVLSTTRYHQSRGTGVQRCSPVSRDRAVLRYPVSTLWADLRHCTGPAVALCASWMRTLDAYV